MLAWLIDNRGGLCHVTARKEKWAHCRQLVKNLWTGAALNFRVEKREENDKKRRMAYSWCLLPSESFAGKRKDYLTANETPTFNPCISFMCLAAKNISTLTLILQGSLRNTLNRLNVSVLQLEYSKSGPMTARQVRLIHFL